VHDEALGRGVLAASWLGPALRHATRASMQVSAGRPAGSPMTPRARATGGAAPPTLLLGLENSNAGAAGRARQPLTRVTLFAPFWLDNRTGRPLTFQDRAAAPGALCLPHGRALGAFAEVQCPGAGARRALPAARARARRVRGGAVPRCGRPAARCPSGRPVPAARLPGDPALGSAQQVRPVMSLARGTASVPGSLWSASVTSPRASSGMTRWLSARSHRADRQHTSLRVGLGFLRQRVGRAQR